jgi:hypothetical protein
MRRARHLLWILAFVALATAPAAHAASVTVQISGTWYAIADSAGVLDGSAGVGDSFAATLVYDDAVGDTDPTIGFGFYVTPAASSDLAISTGNYSFAPASSVNVGVENDNIFGEDWIYLDASSYGMTGPLPSGVSTGATAYSLITLTDYSATAHSSEALLGLNWDLADYDYTSVYLFVQITGFPTRQYIEFMGTIDQISVLPEPSLLILAGLACCLATARFRRV